MNFNLDNDFYCCKCGSRGIRIPRAKGKGRPVGHLKKLYCLKCNQEWNHAETNETTKYTHEDFLLEFNNGNFDNEGNRKVEPYTKFRTKLIKEGVI